MSCLRLLLLSAAVAIAPAAALAQPSAAPRARSFEVSAGVVASGPIDFGAATASLVANQSAAPESTLFRASSSIGTGVGLDGRVAFNITSALAVEGGFAWTRATLESRITADVEGVPNVTLAQDLDTYFIEASAVWHLKALSMGGRALPFVMAGAGYLRQLDEQQVLTNEDPGTVYHVGGGMKYFFMQRPRGFLRGLGLRGDGRFYMRSGGVELDQDTTRRNQWAVTAALLVRF